MHGVAPVSLTLSISVDFCSSILRPYKGAFSEYHPGGSRLLRFAIGADISEHIIGENDVDGIRHVHSPMALRSLRTLIKARLVVPENDALLGHRLNLLGGAQGDTLPSHKRRLSQRGVNLLVFRDATIFSADFITSEKAVDASQLSVFVWQLKTTTRWMPFEALSYLRQPSSSVARMLLVVLLNGLTLRSSAMHAMQSPPTGI